MNTINLKDSTLTNSLIEEIKKKNLKTEIKNIDGYTTYIYQQHERPKVFYKKIVLGRVEYVSNSGTASLALDHPKGVNFLFGKEKEFVSIGRKPKR
ncbi:MAG: hypothetical protein EHM20_09325 [Alphaproteobacteria bacterium]|nr:MAG: hypothetical protein EHM20_12745 [Alphaproteobacteria bacterium]RPJ75209.1 MAG: hypothetical protein EHM20_09325 [Alphaproteobacteria bacterium]